jgi:hypothetical protein
VNPTRQRIHPTSPGVSPAPVLCLMFLIGTRRHWMNEEKAQTVSYKLREELRREHRARRVL